MEYLINGIRGFCMALADSVPGVSGGTIAFIMGFYDKFINSLNSLAFGTKEERKEAVSFLLKILIGWCIGFVIASLVLTSLFETQIYRISSMFIGFIVFSIPLIIKSEKECLKGKYFNLIFTVIGIVIVALITYFNPVSGEGNIVNISNLNIGLCIYIFVVAMIVISAMVLPGISGSTLLLIFGLYIPIMNSVKELLHGNFSAAPVLLLYLFGIVAGIILTIKLIKKALEKYRSQTIYLIIGLMVGSIYAIVMGATTLEVPQAPLSLGTFSFIFFLIGGAIILGLEKLRVVLERKSTEK
jgi:putative membrane protein